MRRARKENGKKGEEERLVEWSELLPLDQHVSFAFSHLTVRERQLKLRKNRLENNQMLSARTICPISVYIFHKFRVTSFFCFEASDKWHLKHSLAWTHIAIFFRFVRVGATLFWAPTKMMTISCLKLDPVASGDWGTAPSMASKTCPIREARGLPKQKSTIKDAGNEKELVIINRRLRNTGDNNRRSKRFCWPTMCFA